MNAGASRRFGEMKPVQDMRGLWAHLPLQCPQLVIAIREKGDLLVHLEVLRVQHLIQTPLGLGIQRLDKPKALARGRPVLYTLSKAQHTLADNNLEVMLLVPPIAHVSPVNAHVGRAIRQRQELPLTGITLDKTRLVDGNQLCEIGPHRQRMTVTSLAHEGEQRSSVPR